MASAECRIPPPHTVRGAIKGWVARNAGLLDGPVLEVGARGSKYWWADCRGLRPDARPWVGVDMQAGNGVDLRADGCSLPFRSGTFGGVLCSEVLEHAWQPALLLAELRRVMRSGAGLIVTTLFAFPYHAYPDDYWRFTESALRRLLAEAGFRRIAVGHAGEVSIKLDDIGERVTRHVIPRNVFAAGVA